MKIELDKEGKVDNVSGNNLPYLTKINNAEELENMTRRYYYYTEVNSFPVWVQEIEHRCSYDYYILTKEDLVELLEILNA
jgi:hypothetical protein